MTFLQIGEFLVYWNLKQDSEESEINYPDVESWNNFAAGNSCFACPFLGSPTQRAKMRKKVWGKMAQKYIDWNLRKNEESGKSCSHGIVRLARVLARNTKFQEKTLGHIQCTFSNLTICHLWMADEYRKRWTEHKSPIFVKFNSKGDNVSYLGDTDRGVLDWSYFYDTLPMLK